MPNREDFGDLKEQYEKLIDDFYSWLDQHWQKVLNGEDGNGHCKFYRN